LNAIAPPERPVGLLIQNGALFPAATLACLAAGRPYVPIDPSYPSMHIEGIIRDAGIGALIVENPEEKVPAESSSLPIIDATSALRSSGGQGHTISLTNGPAAILYTSGSTGRPKGVCFDQQAILERVENTTDAMQASAQDRFALLSSPTTIAALYLPFTALLNGATLYFADARRLGINKVLQTFREGRVTATFAVPALLRELLRSPGAKEAFSQFRALRTGGDVIVARDLDLWRSVLPSTCRVWISLTSTEMPAVFQWIVPPDWEPDGARMPVGYARPEISFEITDEGGAPVTNEAVGELVVKSRHLALGYWQNGGLMPFSTDPNDSSARILRTGDLVRVRKDGLAEMVGRKDRQIKIRGFRINLGEVEGAIRDCVGVASAAVVARQQGEEVSALIAYVAREASCVSETDLRDSLAKRLPIHMRPSRIHFLDAVPLLPGFKVDVSALLEIDRQQSMRTASQCNIGGLPENGHAPVSTAILHRTGADADRVRAAVKLAWTTVLDQRSFETDTSFDDAGGDSLGALHLWSLIENALNAKLSFDSLQLDMTPDALAAAIEKQLTPNKGKLDRASDKPLIFYMPTAEGDTFLQAQLRTGMSADVRFQIARYPSTFDFLKDEAKFEALIETSVRQIVGKTDQPINVLGYSFGGFVAWATACRLQQLGQPLGFVGLIDARRYRDVGEQQHAATPWHQPFGRFLFEPRYAVMRAFQRGLRLTVENCSISIVRKVHKAAALLPPGAAFRADLHFAEQLRMYSGRRWTPTALDHPVCLFRSDEYLPDCPDFGWRKLCPQLDIIPVAGSHDSLLLHGPDRDLLCRRVVQKIQARSEPELRSPAA
jgi:acyl-CoA synthetase (AMP-forming)/AMP-acid ligase II/thioesterase domain-containing protein/acyl carrier protein